MYDSFWEIVRFKFSSGPFCIYISIVTLGMIWAAWKWKRLSAAARGIALIVCAVFLMEVLGWVMIFYYNTNYPTYNLLYVFQFSLYGYTYSRFTTSPPLKQAYLWSGLVLGAVTLVYTIINGWMKFGTVPSATLHFYLILAALLSFLVMLRNPETKVLHLQPLFWFNLANLFFFAGTYFFYGLYDLFRIEGHDRPTWVNAIQIGGNYFLYTSYLAAMVIDATRNAE